MQYILTTEYIEPNNSKQSQLLYNNVVKTAK